MTPLLGNDLQELYEGTGFEGATPRLAKLATPNTLLSSAAAGTPLSTSSVSHTPSVYSKGGAGSVATSSTARSAVMRDHLGLNQLTPYSAAGSVNGEDNDDFSTSGFTTLSSRAEKAREKQLKAQLVAQLKGLPAPEYTYDISIPAVPKEEEEDNGNEGKVEDATEVEDRQRRLLLKEEREEQARRSAVLRRGLPRPSVLPAKIASLSAPSSHLSADQPALLYASSLINNEAVRLIQRDNSLFPDATLPPTSLSSISTMEDAGDDIEDSWLQLAREEIVAEVGKMDHTNHSSSLVPLQRIRFVPQNKGEGRFKVPEGELEVFFSF